MYFRVSFEKILESVVLRIPVKDSFWKNSFRTRIRTKIFILVFVSNSIFNFIGEAGLAGEGIAIMSEES